MKNSNVLSIVLITATLGIVCSLWMKKNRKQALTFNETMELAGQPDQMERKHEEKDQLENAKMVSEGSQFGVQYYNKLAKEEKEGLGKNMENKKK